MFYVVKKFRVLLLSAIFVTLYSVAITYGAPLLQPYFPGETLDPACAPGEVNCSVVLSYPSQTGNGGKMLTTNGTSPSWSTVPVVPTTVSSFTNDSGYLTSFTETDPVFVASASHGITSANILAWNAKQAAITTGTTAQYLRGDLSLATFPTALSSFTNDSGYITGITSGNVTTALGYTPYNATNPAGYISSFTETDPLSLHTTGGTLTGALNGAGATWSGAQVLGTTGGAVPLVFQYNSINAASRSWRMIDDQTAYGDLSLQQSTTQAGPGYTTVLYFSPTGNVGVGTTTPSALFSVGTASPFQVTNTGAVTGLSYNGLTLTANATGFAVAGGTTSKTLTVSNTLTFAGTDATTMTFPTTSATLARTDAAQTFTGVQSFSSPLNVQTYLTVGLGGAAEANSVALGRVALTSATSGIRNIAIGYAALGGSGFSGTYNVGIGFSALSAASNNGSNNTAIGAYASQLMTGSNNIVISGNTTGGMGLTTGSNNTIIGQNITGLAAGLANNIILADGAGNIKFQWDGTNIILNGPVTATTVNGLSLTANATGFAVAGGTTSKTLTVSNNLTLAGTDGSTLNIGAGGTLGSNAFSSVAYLPLAGGTLTGGLIGTSANFSGNVGIGVTPVAGLDVQKAVTASSGSAFGTRLQQALTAAANNDALSALYFSPSFNDNAKTGVTHLDIGFSNTASHTIGVVTDGAISTSSGGSITFGQPSYSYPGGNLTLSAGATSPFYGYLPAKIILNGGDYNAGGGDLTLQAGQTATSSGNVYFKDGSGNTKMTIDTSGRVGIGTTPSYPLDVAMNSNAARFGSAGGNNNVYVYNSGAGLDMWVGGGGVPSALAASGSLGFYTNQTLPLISGLAGQTAVMNMVGSNVGIGTTAPLAKLTVNTTTNTDFEVRNGADYGAGFSGVGIDSRDDTRSTRNMMIINGNPIVMNGGNVGIGTTTPGTTLDVAGTLRLTGNTYYNGGTNNFTGITDVLNVNKTLSLNPTDSWSIGTTGGSLRLNSVAVLYNGKVYLWGGYVGGAASNTLDIYDIASATWSTGTAGGTARNTSTGTLYNGKIYIWGGANSAGTSINTVDIYDIATNSWSTGTAGGTARADQTATLYNGKIYYFGGVTSGTTAINTVDIYDIATNSWSTGTAGGTARFGHTATLYNGKIYMLAGAQTGGAKINTIDIYDIVGNNWYTGTAGGTAKYDHTAVLYNGKIYSYGGFSSPTFFNTLDIYTISTDSWSTGTAGGTGRSAHSAISYNGKMYTFGGQGIPGALNSVDVYDFANKQNIFSIQENGQDTINFQTGSQMFLNSGRLGIMGGNVGIGTTAPVFPLHVIEPYTKTSTGTQQFASFFSTNETATVGSSPFGLRIGIIGAAAIANRYASLQTTDWGLADGGNIVMQASGGNVGIGTTSPSTSLDIQSTTAASLKVKGVTTSGATINIDRASTAYSSTLYFTTNGTIDYAMGTGQGSAGTSDFSIYGYGVPGNALTILKATNQVLIGTTTAADTSRNLQVGNGSTTGRVLINSYGVYALLLRNGSNNGIYVGADTAATDTNLMIVSGTSGGNLASINGLTGAYTALSDRNKKKNFEDYTGGLSQILQLKPTLYNYKTEDDSAPKSLGFIAQDVKGVVPQAYTEQGDFIGLNYSAFTPVIVNAIKELDLKIAPIPQYTDPNLINKLHTFLTDVVENSHIAIDLLTAKQIDTEKLCIKKSDGSSVCIDGDQLQNILNGTQAASVIPLAPVTPPSTPVVVPPVTPDPVVTPIIPVPDPAVTPLVAPVVIPDPIPTPTPVQ